MRLTPEKFDEMEFETVAYVPEKPLPNKPLTIFLIICAVGALIYVLSINPL